MEGSNVVLGYASDYDEVVYLLHCVEEDSGSVPCAEAAFVVGVHLFAVREDRIVGVGRVLAVARNCHAHVEVGLLVAGADFVGHAFRYSESVVEGALLEIGYTRLTSPFGFDFYEL